ncbi:MAG: hypothetical protein ACE5R6_10300 [Candidatus Heimdallarchaeota archaeon]
MRAVPRLPTPRVGVSPSGSDRVRAVLTVLATIVHEHQIDVHNLERAETIPLVDLIAVYVMAQLKQAPVEQMAPVLFPFLHDESQHVRLFGIFLLFSLEDPTFKTWVSQIERYWGEEPVRAPFIADLLQLLDVKPKGVCIRFAHPNHV